MAVFRSAITRPNTPSVHFNRHHSYPNAGSHTHKNIDSGARLYPAPRAHTHCHAISHLYAGFSTRHLAGSQDHTDSYADKETDTDADSHQYADSNQHADTDLYRRSDIRTTTNPHTDSYMDSHINSDSTPSDTDAHVHAYATP